MGKLVLTMKVKKRYDRLQPVFEKWEKRIAKPPRKAACEMVQDIDSDCIVEFRWLV